jgi:uncharacterized protein VirK/YbjX
VTTVSNDRAHARSPWFARATASFAVIQQAAYALYPGTSVFHRWRRMRLWLRSLMSWRSTQVWLKRCAISPLHDLVQRHPTALERMHRPFLHTRFSPRERLMASLDHHALTQQRVPQLAARIAAVGSAPIASFEVGAERWHVSLESIEQFQKEGDWTLWMRETSASSPAPSVSPISAVKCGGRVFALAPCRVRTRPSTAASCFARSPNGGMDCGRKCW